MPRPSQYARDLIDAWQVGRHDDHLVDQLGRESDTGELTRYFWILRFRSKAGERAELLRALGKAQGRPASRLRLELLVPTALSSRDGYGSALPGDAETDSEDGFLDTCLLLDHRACSARARQDLDQARSWEALLDEELDGRADPFFRHLLDRRRIEDALDAGDGAKARVGIDRLYENLAELVTARSLLEPGIELLRARLQEVEDDPECLWSLLALSRDFRLLDADREEATLRAAEVMGQRRRLAGALALQLELVHGSASPDIRLKSLRALVRDMVRGTEAAAARSYAESLVELLSPDCPDAGEALGMSALAAIRAGDTLTALDFHDRAAMAGCDDALLALTDLIESIGRGESGPALARAEQILKTPAAEDRPGPWRGLLALERMRALRRADRATEELVRAAESAIRESAHARDMETLRDAYFSLALLLAERPESRERAIAACREAESLTRNLLEAIDADRELLFKIMPRDAVIRTVVSSLMGRITDQARQSTTQLLELGATLAREAERGRELLDALRASQRRVSRLLETLPIVIWTSWGRSRAFGLCSVDGAVRPLFGLDADQLRARPEAWIAAVHPSDQPMVMATLAEVESRLTGRSIEFRMASQGHDSIWVEMHIEPILGDPDGDGVLHGIIADVSERRALQENIQRVQKLEGLGRLAGGLTHDFNNLFGSILGAATLLMQTTPRGSSQDELLHVIEKASVRGTELVTSLRGFARSDQGRLEVIDLGALTQETVELGRGLLRPNIAVDFVRPDESCWVLCQRATLTQVLLEIMTNADEAAPEDGRIRIELAIEGAAAVLRVIDRGRGMEEETRARAFDPFYGTKDARRHRGLGLTMVYKAVRELGGQVAIVSAPGQGTEIVLTLPLADRPEVSSEQAHQTTQVLLTEGRLLLIDDDPQILRVSEMILTRAGFDVVVAGDGREGLARFHESPDDWTLVVSDVRMPRCDGISLAREIRGLSEKPPILLMTGFAEESPKTLLSSLSGIAIIRKPFTASSFLDAAAVLLDSGSTPPEVRSKIE